jgi:hypothetical protein
MTIVATIIAITVTIILLIAGITIIMAMDTSITHTIILTVLSLQT